MMKTFTTLICGLLISLMSSNLFAADDFPLRAKFPNVKPVLTEDLGKDFDKYIIIDVRSTMEYDVAHVNGAKHVSLSNASFTQDLEKVRGKNDPTPMAFYCNGHTCSKSYKAYEKAAEAGFTNIFAFDAGIFDWIMAHPEKATLMGKTPAPAEKIIPKSELIKKMLNYADFKAKAAEANSMVIDIREPFQRTEIPEIPNLRNIPLDRLIGLVKQKQFANNNLLILDAVGKQVDWLQYHLEDNGYTNYNFLEKGVAGIK